MAELRTAASLMSTPTSLQLTDEICFTQVLPESLFTSMKSSTHTNTRATCCVGGLAAEEEVKISWLLPWQGLTTSYQDTWPSHICTVYCVAALPWAQRILSISTTSAQWRLELLPYPKKLTVSQNSWLPPGPLVIHSPLLECSLHLGWGHIIISLHFLSIQRQGGSNSYTFWAI